MNRLVAAMLRGLIGFYRYAIAPLIGPCCRFEPSCSRYALLAIDTHGPWRGAWLTIKRIVRCQPWGGQGFDPVPPRLAAPSNSLPRF
jgi:putative membrane protein insertion efficiency factor